MRPHRTTRTLHVTRTCPGRGGGLRSRLEMARTRRQIEARIERIKGEIVKLDRIHPGSLSKQYNVCGHAQCRCKASPPRRHGPYHQVSFTWRGKNTSRFVRKGDLDRVQRELRNYERLRQLTDEWIELSMELTKLDKAHDAA